MLLKTGSCVEHFQSTQTSVQNTEINQDSNQLLTFDLILKTEPEFNDKFKKK